jgi:antitoxin (DNA-binding transcriptional repressor) of toxin-antitoxin stability system
VKAISIREAQGQLGQLIAEACRGETIVLTDGDKRVTLEPGVPLDLEEDSPELEAELLKAVNGPHSPLREGELREIADRALREHRARR